MTPEHVWLVLRLLKWTTFRVLTSPFDGQIPTLEHLKTPNIPYYVDPGPEVTF